MEAPIKILILEDTPTDVELAEREIKKILKSYKLKHVVTREEFIKSSISFKPDVLISDYRLPDFDGLSALKFMIEHSPLTPVIIFTGSINEDTAVECMKAGANDYVLKERIKRLGTAILSALRQKKIRMDQIKAQKALVESEERYRRITQTITDYIYTVKVVQQLQVIPAKNLPLILIFGIK
jgi:DNA-binding NtrC family response regulator